MGVLNPCSSTPTLNLFLNFNLLLKPSKHSSIQLFMYSSIHVLKYSSILNLNLNLILILNLNLNLNLTLSV